MAEPSASTPNPRDQAISRGEESILWRTLSEIQETYREPLVLFCREQQSVEQVATALDLAEDAVKQRLFRGRAVLKEQVAAFVETTLRNARPGKAFTLAVLVALPAIVPSATAAGLVAGAGKGSAAVKSAAAGLSGAEMGPLLGIPGAYIGAKASIKNTKSPRERQFMVQQTWTMLEFDWLECVSRVAVRFDHAGAPAPSAAPSSAAGGRQITAHFPRNLPPGRSSHTLDSSGRVACPSPRMATREQKHSYALTF